MEMDKLVAEMKRLIIKRNRPSKMIMSEESLKCPGCRKTMVGSIHLCNDGHSLCGICYNTIRLCPICGETYTNVRNLSLEALIVKDKMPCIHRSSGCDRQLHSWEMNEHILECTFRWITCPLKATEDCKWFGPLQHLSEHLYRFHPDDICSSNSNIQVPRLILRQRKRRVSLHSHRRLLFVVTMFVNPRQGFAYWTVQFMGSPNEAKKYIYEIYVASVHDPVRRIVFSEYCTSDTANVSDVIASRHCPMMMLDKLVYFMMENKLHFECVIRDTDDLELGKCDVYSHTSAPDKNTSNEAQPQSSIVLIITSDGPNFSTETHSSTFQD